MFLSYQCKWRQRLSPFNFKVWSFLKGIELLITRTANGMKDFHKRKNARSSIPNQIWLGYTIGTKRGVLSRN